MAVWYAADAWQLIKPPLSRLAEHKSVYRPLVVAR
jgi:hypothetical protein